MLLSYSGFGFANKLAFNKSSAFFYCLLHVVQTAFISRTAFLENLIVVVFLPVSSTVVEYSAGVATTLLRFLQFGSEGLFLTPAGAPGPPFANHFVPLGHTHLPRLPMSCCFRGGHNTLFLAGGSRQPSPQPSPASRTAAGRSSL